MELCRIVLPRRLDGSGSTEISRQLRAAEGSPAIMLSGTSEEFCLGMDLQRFARSSDSDASLAQIRAELEAFADCLELLLSAPRPTLAVVQGPALGGGLGLAAACDFVLATDKAVFGVPEGLYGLTPAIIRPALQLRMTTQQIHLLAFTGHARSVVEAEKLGLVDQIADDRALEGAVRSMGRKFARCSTPSIRAMRQHQATTIRESIKRGVEETFDALTREDVRRALAILLSEEGLPWAQ